MPTRRVFLILVLPVLIVVALAGSPPARAVCITSDCAQGSLPAECQDRAGPRMAKVNLVGVNNFSPNDPQPEPDQCIQWVQTAAFTHSSTGSGNPVTCADRTCADNQNLCQGPDCKWETGDVLPASPPVICYYRSSLFPAGATENFCCRFHAALGMVGVLSVSSAIGISSVNKIGDNLRISWAGGQGRYQVERSTADPTFPSGSTETFNPNLNVANTVFTDVGELLRPDARFYLIRNLSAPWK